MVFRRAHGTIEQRFMGSGNCWIGSSHQRGWQVKCSRCPNTKTITSHNAKRMPPGIIVKKFSQSGWTLGNRDTQDICPDCQKTARKSALGGKLAEASKALQAAAKPMVQNGSGQRLHYSELEHMTKALTPEQTKDLIKTLQANLPKRTYKKTSKPLPESDVDYEAWLNNLKQE
jgi:hypothetical protein